jgi:hypothetical protein
MLTTKFKRFTYAELRPGDLIVDVLNDHRRSSYSILSIEPPMWVEDTDAVCDGSRRAMFHVLIVDSFDRTVTKVSTMHLSWKLDVDLPPAPGEPGRRTIIVVREG